MIKIVASDMDGTLLNNNHEISEKTMEAIHVWEEKGMRFMIVTGRNYTSARQALDLTDLKCDCILSSGAEVRNAENEVLLSLPLGQENCKFLYEKIRNYPICMMFCTEYGNFMIGTKEEVDDGIINYIKYFHLNLDREELKKTNLYHLMWKKTTVVSDFHELIEKNIPITKLFLVSDYVDMLQRIKEELEENNNLAVSSSFKNNLEITDYRAQKGPILKEYIEKLGYTMDEVMVLGDSLNDYSMISMDFGATVAMENADEEIKEIAKYITKSNEEDGVAFAIHEMIKKYKL